MLEISIGLCVALLVITLPWTRRAALSLLGLLAIVVVGSTLFAALIWALYESKTWLIAEDPGIVQQAPLSGQEDLKEAPPPEPDGGDAIQDAEEDLQFALASEEAQRLDEARRRIAVLAARARVILEEDRKLAAQAIAYPLPAGVSDRLADIMAIRIPAWRNKGVAAAQKESIRAWLQSIGLDVDETARIVTAKAWGALYDIWVVENPGVATPSPRAGEPESLPAGEPPVGRDEPPPSESAQEPPSFVSQVPPSRQAAPAPPAKRYSILSPATPSRPLPPEPEVGPFGY
jgi:hypothetical protein